MPDTTVLIAAALLARFLVQKCLSLKSFINQIDHRYESFEIEYHRISAFGVGCGHRANVNTRNVDNPCADYHAAVDLSGEYHPTENGSGQHSAAIDITGCHQTGQHYYPAVIDDRSGKYRSALHRTTDYRAVQHQHASQYNDAN